MGILRLRSPKATLSKTLMCGNSAYFWKTVLTLRLYGGVRETSSPSSRMRPSVGDSKPAIIRSVVVLPQPEGPSMEKNSPPAMAKSARCDRHEGAEPLADLVEDDDVLRPVATGGRFDWLGHGQSGSPLCSKQIRCVGA